MRFPCDGAYQDECGTWTCRLDPEDPSFDCHNCHHRITWQQYIDRMEAMQREEQDYEDRWEKWG